LIYAGYGRSDPYASNQVFDLRTEFSALLYGDAFNPGIAQPVLIRRLSDKKCICFDTLRGSPDPHCKYCQGEGFLWVETLNNCYVARNFGSVLNPANVISRQNFTAPTGIDDENRALAYFEYSVFPNYERYTIPTHPAFDKLYELKVDAGGNVLQPVIRTAKWSIQSLTVHRGDLGAPIYTEIGMQKEYL
jgi:hypothetical protein